MRKKPHLYCTYFIIMCCLLLSSCGSTTIKKDTVKDSVSIYALPAPKPLAEAEARRLHDGCETWYESKLKRTGFNGGIVVAKNGNIIFEDYNGTGHLNDNDTINANTPFHIASVSKTFTAMAVQKLWQDGKLNIDDEFSKYFPQFDYPGVTVRTLLNHRSGLPNYVYFMETLGWDKTKFVTNADVLNYMITKKGELTNVAKPNTHFAYCNTNYALLALLIEKVTGKKYPDFMKETFFTPLNMKNTFVFDTSMLTKVNPSYDWRGRIIPLGFLDAVYGDKNIYTTPRELLIWDRAISSGKIFTEKTLAETYAPYSNEKPGVRNYGLGWRMNLYPNGKKMIYHNGWWHGNNAAFVRLLDEDATIIVLGNKFNRNIYHAKEMANLFSNYTGDDEEEETEASKPMDTTAVKATAPVKKVSPVKHHRRRRR